MGKIKKCKRDKAQKIKSIKRTFLWYLPLCVVVAYLGVCGIGLTANELQAWFEINYSDDYQEQLKKAYEKLELLHENGVTGDMAAGEDGEPQETEQYVRIEYVKTVNGLAYYDVRALGKFVSDNPWLDFLYNLISYGQGVLMVGWVLLCVGSTGIVFYKRELEKPIAVLMDASEKISENCLDFEMKPVKQNELGQLCRSFEDMRQALYENNRELWRTLEERKRLNAAFSHDIRTPLSVLKGYQEMLQNYVPEGKFSEGQLMEMIETMGTQIERLENYTRKMSAVQKLEDIVPEAEMVEMKVLTEQCLQTGKLLTGELEFKLQVEQGDMEKAESASEQANLAESVFIDKELVLEVYENLVSNAARFAKSKLLVTFGSMPETEGGAGLVLTVEDDGPGFSEEALHRGTDPFYGSEKDGRVHFGLGLYICKTICEKHGGGLRIENRTSGATVRGGRVTAIFGVTVVKNNGRVENKTEIAEK